MTTQAKLHDLVAAKHLLKHPFYRAWTEGALTIETLRHYAVQYYPHVSAFPRFVSTIHSLCEDEQSRRSLFMNLSEEEGARFEESQPELWKNFGVGLGSTREQIREGEKGVESLRLVNTFFKLCRSSYAEGLGALIAYELQVPKIAEVKIEGLKRFYGIEDAFTLKFFEVHQTADKFHSEACIELLLALSPRDQEIALKAVDEALDGLWDFLTEVHAH